MGPLPVCHTREDKRRVLLNHFLLLHQAARTHISWVPVHRLGQLALQTRDLLVDADDHLHKRSQEREEKTTRVNEGDDETAATDKRLLHLVHEAQGVVIDSNRTAHPLHSSPTRSWSKSIIHLLSDLVLDQQQQQQQQTG